MEVPNIKAKPGEAKKKRWVDDKIAVVGKNCGVRSAQDQEVGRSDESPTCSSGWIKAEEEEEEAA